MRGGGGGGSIRFQFVRCKFQRAIFDYGGACFGLANLGGDREFSFWSVTRGVKIPISSNKLGARTLPGAVAGR